MDALKRAEERLERLYEEIDGMTGTQIEVVLNLVEATASVAKVQQLKRHVDVMEAGQKTKRDMARMMKLLGGRNESSQPSLMRQRRTEMLERVIDRVENYGSISNDDVETLKQMLAEMQE